MSVSSVLSPPVNPDVDRDHARKDQRLIGQLVQLWKSHRTRDLEVRRRTGALLNEHLGPPTGRQRYGRRVLKRASEALHASASELSRMRWLAHVLDHRDAYPQLDSLQIDSWTQFKEVLPNLKSAEDGLVEEAPANRSRPALGGVVRSLKGVAAKLDGLLAQPEEAERQAFLETLRELAEAAGRRLQIRVEVVVG